MDAKSIDPFSFLPFSAGPRSCSELQNVNANFF